jgi:chorismate mutase
MTIRGIRGAITIDEDQPEPILSATREMLEGILTANPTLRAKDIASVLFTVTDDIASAFPAGAARQMGWDLVPVMCMHEIPVPDSLPLCIRVLIHWNTDLPQNAIRHAYLRKAINLRPDLTVAQPASIPRRLL